MRAPVVTQISSLTRTRQSKNAKVPVRRTCSERGLESNLCSSITSNNYAFALHPLSKMIMYRSISILVTTVLGFATAFTPVRPSIIGSQTITSMASGSTLSISPTPVDDVVILADADAVSASVREIVKDAALRAIGERGHFALAIPGGSILKMLAGEAMDEAWTSKTTIAYVNHKCVPMDDMELATHAKAHKLFLDTWVGAEAILMDGTDDGEAEAKSYEAKLKGLSEDILPRCTDTGLPVFDLALIGVGDDGHVGE